MSCFTAALIHNDLLLPWFYCQENPVANNQAVAQWFGMQIGFVNSLNGLIVAFSLFNLSSSSGTLNQCR
jgi:hypothetical protein